MIVFVCGLSQSGKSTLIQSTQLYIPKLRHIRASALLRRAGQPVFPIRSKDVLANQKILVREVRTETEDKNANFVLDGHFLIEASDGPYILPPTCLDGLRLDAVFMVVADPVEISKRRQETSAQITPQEAAERIVLETMAAERLAGHKKIPFQTIQSDDAKGFSSALKAFFTS
jgi:adenylate kinase